jgi:hypothetical protein
MKKQKENSLSEAPKKKKKIRRKKKPTFKLTKKQDDFCHAYIDTGNATESYRMAYNASGMKEATINVKACVLMKQDKVKVRIEELYDKLRSVEDIRKERLLYELDAILNAKITDYLDFDGTKITWKGFDKLTDKQIRAIERIKISKDKEVEFWMHGKNWSLDRICKILGYEAPKKIDHTTGGDKIQSDKIIILPSNDRQ